MSSWVTELEEYLPLRSKWTSSLMEWHSRAQQEWAARLREGSSPPSGGKVLRKHTTSFLLLMEGWWVCRFTRRVWWRGLALSVLASQAFTRRTVVSWEGAGMVLPWGDCPPSSSPGVMPSPPPVRTEPNIQTWSSGHGFWSENIHFNRDLLPCVLLCGLKCISKLSSKTNFTPL